MSESLITVKIPCESGPSTYKCLVTGMVYKTSTLPVSEARGYPINAVRHDAPTRELKHIFRQSYRGRGHTDWNTQEVKRWLFHSRSVKRDVIRALYLADETDSTFALLDAFHTAWNGAIVSTVPCTVDFTQVDWDRVRSDLTEWLTAFSG